MPVVSRSAMMRSAPVRPMPRRQVMLSGPYGYASEDFGGWFKKLKKAISIKNVKKVVKKAAPVALAVATGGASAGVAAAVTKVASSLLRKPEQQQIVEQAVQQYQTGGASALLSHSLDLAKQRLAASLMPVEYSQIPAGVDLRPATTANNLAAIPSIDPPQLRPARQLPANLEQRSRTRNAPAPEPIGGGMPSGMLIAGAAVLGVMLLSQRRR